MLAGVADLVIGSRRRAVRGAATGHMPLHQRLGNDWLALNLWLFFGLRLSDDGPFRAVRIDLLESLRLEERAYAFPTEMAVKARLAGARIAVRDTRYRARAGSSKIAGTWRGSALAVRDITGVCCAWACSASGRVRRPAAPEPASRRSRSVHRQPRVRVPAREQRVQPERPPGLREAHRQQERGHDDVGARPLGRARRRDQQVQLEEGGQQRRDRA